LTPLRRFGRPGALDCRAVRRRRVSFIACALATAVVLSACGARGSQSTTGDANNTGFYVRGGPLTYQVEISRALNPYATEDSQYLVGLPQGISQPGASQLWFAVFVWAKNFSTKTYTTVGADNFDIVDTQGNVYYPTTLNPSLNPLAWSAETLKPQGTEPAVDTLASGDPAQGSELLFKLDDSIYANRPLTLQIHVPGQARPSTISLDL
jgi:hypothetical protein